MLNEFLEKASKAYYEGHPFISDEEFDFLEKQTKIGVGYSVEDGVPHYARMYSLQKAYVGDSKFPLDGYGKDVIKSVKLDGAAISLLYVPNNEGRLSFYRGLTRGDGIKGKDITDNIRSLVPPTIPGTTTTQVNCEVVAPKTASENPRNYAAGALNLKSVEEFSTRELRIIALDAYPYTKRTYTETLSALASMGFTTINSKDFCISDYPTDGMVFRVDDNFDFYAFGHTNKHPRGSFALKRQAKGQWTKLNKVIWNVGRSGVVTPVAYIEPINIDGAVVSKATLHNLAHINSLGLKLGDEVLVIRSGEIIPKIIARRDNESKL